MSPFRLDALRHHRKHKEDLLQKELAAADRCLCEELRREKEWRRIQRRFADRCRREVEGGTPVCRARLYRGYLQRIEQDIASQQKKVEASRQKVERMRRRLIEAMKKRKMVDRLREKHLAAARHEQDRQEQSFMNEVAVIRFNHGERPESPTQEKENR